MEPLKRMMGETKVRWLVGRAKERAVAQIAELEELRRPDGSWDEAAVEKLQASYKRGQKEDVDKLRNGLDEKWGDDAISMKQMLDRLVLPGSGPSTFTGYAPRLRTVHFQLSR